MASISSSDISESIISTTISNELTDWVKGQVRMRAYACVHVLLSGRFWRDDDRDLVITCANLKESWGGHRIIIMRSQRFVDILAQDDPLVSSVYQ